MLHNNNVMCVTGNVDKLEKLFERHFCLIKLPAANAKRLTIRWHFYRIVKTSQSKFKTNS